MPFDKFGSLVICICTVVAVTAVAVSNVGEMPDCEPFGWALPVIVFLFLGWFVGMGYVAGRIDAM